MNFTRARRFVAHKKGATTGQPKPTVDRAIAIRATHSFTFSYKRVVQFSPVAHCAGGCLATSTFETQGEVA